MTYWLEQKLHEPQSVEGQSLLTNHMHKNKYLTQRIVKPGYLLSYIKPKEQAHSPNMQQFLEELSEKE